MNKWKGLEIIQKKGGKEISGWRAQGRKEGRKERDGDEDTEEMVCLWIAVGLIHSPCCNLKKVVCLPSKLIASLCFLNFREDVTVVPSVQKEWAQAARLVSTASGPGHVFCPVPSCRMVQSACGSSALHRHPDAQLCGFTTQCECQQVYCSALQSVRFVLGGLYVGHSLFNYVLHTFSVIVS